MTSVLREGVVSGHLSRHRAERAPSRVPHVVHTVCPLSHHMPHILSPVSASHMSDADHLSHHIVCCITEYRMCPVAPPSPV